MTRFTVVWDQQADDELAEIWLVSSIRRAVTDAADAINAQLGFDAEVKGVDLVEGLRAIEVRPLRAIFSVGVADRIARVVAVKLMPQ